MTQQAHRGRAHRPLRDPPCWPGAGRSPVAVTAVARELAGFVWAEMTSW